MTVAPDAHATPPLRLQTSLKRPGFALNVDVTLPAHGVTALFGPSGSGKTTCLRVLAGLEPQAQGHISVAAEVWQDTAQRIFKPVHLRALGYVFQEASLFEHLSVQGNLTFGHARTPTAQRRHGWDHGLDLLGIRHLLARMPHELSGGERQRVAMARAAGYQPTRAADGRAPGRPGHSPQSRHPAVAGTVARGAGHSGDLRDTRDG
jgi:molybdate transport system ATP-binding protein